MKTGTLYTLDMSNASNSSFPMRFSTTPDGTFGGGAEYTTGVTRYGRPGQAGSKVTILTPATPTNINYYCSNQSGMGGAVAIN